MEVEQIVALVKPPLTCMKDARGVYLCDQSTIAAKCPKGHPHKYFVSSIVAAGGWSLCKTCTKTNIFSTMVREQLELTMGVPFVSTDNKMHQARGYEYVNPIVGINVACVSNAGEDKTIHTPRGGEDGVNGAHMHTLIVIHKTDSLRRVKLALYGALWPRRKEFPPEVVTRIRALTARKKRVVLPPKKRMGKKLGANQREPMPVLPEFGGSVENADLLCYENC